MRRNAHSVSRVKNKKGVILILTFIVMVTLTVIVAAFLYMTSIQIKSAGYDLLSAKALWLAEAGIQKAVWNLKTPVTSGGQGEDWTTAGATESLGDGSYTMVVARWDYALASNGATASGTYAAAGVEPAKAIDNNDATYWESAEKPKPGTGNFDKSPELIITFPYILTINKIRFLVPAGSSQQAPKDYTWEVSSDGVNYTIVISNKNNNKTDVTHAFSAAFNVKYLKLKVAKIVGGSDGVRIATMEAIGARITVTGTVNSISRKITRTVVADDATQTAFPQIDWNEIVPAL